MARLCLPGVEDGVGIHFLHDIFRALSLKLWWNFSKQKSLWLFLCCKNIVGGFIHGVSVLLLLAHLVEKGCYCIDMLLKNISHGFLVMDLLIFGMTTRWALCFMSTYKNQCTSSSQWFCFGWVMASFIVTRMAARVNYFWGLKNSASFIFSSRPYGLGFDMRIFSQVSFLAG